MFNQIINLYFLSITYFQPPKDFLACLSFLYHFTFWEQLCHHIKMWQPKYQDCYHHQLKIHLLYHMLVTVLDFLI